MSSDRPALVVREHAAGVRLHLGAIAHGDGPSLQEAADDLVRRALAIGRALRTGGFSVSTRVAARRGGAELSLRAGRDRRRGRRRPHAALRRVVRTRRRSPDSGEARVMARARCSCASRWRAGRPFSIRRTARNDPPPGLSTNLMSPRLTRRIHRTRAPGSDAGDEPDVVELESVELSGVFSAPQWLRDLGFASWLLAGVGAVLIGATWVAALTSTIVVPVVVAGVVAAVTSPLVRQAPAPRTPARPRARRSSSSASLVLGAAFVVMIVGGISSQASALTPKLAQGADKIQGWLQDLGVSSDSAKQANSDAGSGLSDGFHALARRRGDRGRGPRVAGGLPLVHRPEPLLLPQGRPGDPGVGGTPPRRAAAGRPHRRRPHAAVAAGIFRGRHRRRRVQRHRHRPRGAHRRRARRRGRSRS